MSKLKEGIVDTLLNPKPTLFQTLLNGHFLTLASSDNSNENCTPHP